ncbi:hypothetical protein Metig_0494 [Methanotorris igneus Kol 5]|uniref:Uncharacterized protein n=1 Tax=Methanotorris igneus (strain DSM 5666 / JCM 11834 / Kol 5) TaxID=880724 RepID=F6BBP1_METIK|nr:hypothetical protein Metig_0494 [Methanotorris igneus Kol 5]
MYVHVCPYCLNPVLCYQKDYLEHEVHPVKVDVENLECSVLLGSKIYKNAQCSNLQGLKIVAGKIASKLKLGGDEKKAFMEKVEELKRQHPRWKDYKILETALNSVLQGG